MVVLSIIRYKSFCVPFAFLAMAIFRIPLYFNKNISFYKLMGSGRNGTFDKVPDLRQWAIFSVGHDTEDTIHNKRFIADHYGSFICTWLKLFRCEICTFYLQPAESHGVWDSKKPFGDVLPGTIQGNEPVAVLTRATIRLTKLKYFWQNVAPVAALMPRAKGFITSYGIGEIPWIKQATFSIWKSKEDMKAFAYGTQIHSDVIKKTRAQKWYKEEMFTRFSIKGINGTINGKKPLEGML